MSEDNEIGDTSPQPVQAPPSGSTGSTQPPTLRAPDLAGATLRAGDTLTITAGARSTVLVPDVRGGEEDLMLDVLRDTGLRPERRVTRRSDCVPEGHILRTRPRAGSSVPLGTKVTYVVATPRPHGRQARRHEKRIRASRLPDGSLLSLPSDE